MTDLIKQLRYAAQGELFGDTLLEEAADRIAELELSNNGMHKTIERLTHRNGVECVHGKFLHEDCPKCRGEVK